MQKWFTIAGWAAILWAGVSNGFAQDTGDTGDVSCVEALWFVDVDGDGHGDPDDSTVACEQPSGFVAVAGDCDDSDADISPDADEVCDGADNDCDSVTDEDDAVDAPIWYDDADSDGHGDPNDGLVACEQPVGHVASATDCDDLRSAANPDEIEACDGFDNDCDGDTDEADAIDTRTWYADDDGDGFGNSAAPTVACRAPEGHLSDSADCNDEDAQINPNAEDEPYDGIDQDCDGTDLTDVDGDGFEGTVVDGGTDCDDADRNISPAATEIWYDGIDQDCDGGNDFDQDGDGHDATLANGGDCDDVNPDVNPGLDEQCEAGLQVDTDCDGDPNTDRDGPLQDPQASLFRDADGDGQGAGDPILVCGISPGYERDALDCDDSDPTVYSGAEEYCDGRDQNCDARIDESTLEEPALGCVTFFEDADSDGFGNPTAEVCLCVDGADDSPELSGVSHVRGNADCNDNDATIHPPSCADQIDNDGDGLIDDDDPQCDGTHDEFGDPESHHERRNGHDDDCDGLVMAIELDCDADGHVAQVPADRGGALSDPVGAPVTAAGLGLQACEADADQPRRAMTCWSTEIFLRCDEDLGLWMYNYTTDTTDRFVQGIRASMNGSDRVDCDDQCADRSPSAAEVCDGIDNDCSDTTVSGGDSLPAAMLRDVPVAGSLSASEVDLDRDGALSCSQLRDDAPQLEFSGDSCGSTPRYAEEDDWNPMCSLSGPGLADACDGFAASSPDEREADTDTDGFASCGAFSSRSYFSGEFYYATSSEQLYVPVWLAPSPARAGGPVRDLADLFETLSEPAPLVPLILPRMQADGPRVCDQPLADQLDLLLAEDDLSVEALLALPPEVQARRLAEACDNRGGSCTIVELTWERDSDQDRYEALYSAADTGAGAGGAEAELLLPECEERPEEWIVRSVWLQDRVLQARQTVEAVECQRLYGLPCAEVSEADPLLAGWESMPDATEHLEATESLWWVELGELRPLSLTEGMLLTCDGDPTDESVSPLRITGGDCDDDNPLTNREMAEGEDLLAVFFGEAVDCSTCFDCIDNNCDGYVDIEDPSCVRCHLTTGCSAPCEQGEGCSSRATGRAMFLSPALVVLFMLRRREP